VRISLYRPNPAYGGDDMQGFGPHATLIHQLELLAIETPFKS
jgi:FKBP-type peptidyl-prolyl cis-trans isomerase